MTASNNQTNTESLLGMMYDLRNIATTASNSVEYFTFMRTYFVANSNLDQYVAFSTDVDFTG
jgi:hypothetical protein